MSFGRMSYSSLCVLGAVLLVDAFLVRVLGMSVDFTRVLYGIITGLYALDNWSLYKDLKEAQAQNKASPHHSYRSTQDRVIEKLVSHNSILEQQNFHLKIRLSKSMRKPFSRSFSLPKSTQGEFE
jgi:hypothetical protein